MIAELVLPGYLDTAAILTGALTGAMYAKRKGLDIAGVFLVAISTGVGGGLVRDVLLQQGVPVFFQHPAYQLYALIGAVLAIFFAEYASKFNPAYEALDTFMIGAWVLLGCGKAQAAGVDLLGVAFIGTVAAVAGMMLRDVLCHDPPVLMRPGHFYAISAAAAAGSYVVLLAFGVALLYCQVVAMAVAIITRVISVKFDIRTPGPFDVSERVLQTLRLSKTRHKISLREQLLRGSKKPIA